MQGHADRATSIGEATVASSFVSVQVVRSDELELRQTLACGRVAAPVAAERDQLGRFVLMGAYP